MVPGHWEEYAGDIRASGSDIDLLVLMGDQAIARFADAPAAMPWARAGLLVHNSPAGATSVGATHIRSGLPLRVDLHVHPTARTRWPTDGRIVFERRPIELGVSHLTS